MERTDTSLACRKQFFYFACSCWLMPRLKVGPIFMRPLLFDCLYLFCPYRGLLLNLWSTFNICMYYLFILSIKYQSCIEIMGKAGCCMLNWSLYHECHCNQYVNSNLDFCIKIQIQKVTNLSLYQTVAERARSCWGNILPHKSQLYCTCWESLCCASSQEIFLPTMPLSGFFCTLAVNISCEFPLF